MTLLERGRDGPFSDTQTMEINTVLICIFFSRVTGLRNPNHSDFGKTCLGRGQCVLSVQQWEIKMQEFKSRSEPLSYGELGWTSNFLLELHILSIQKTSQKLAVWLLGQNSWSKSESSWESSRNLLEPFHLNFDCRNVLFVFELKPLNEMPFKIRAELGGDEMWAKWNEPPAAVTGGFDLQRGLRPRASFRSLAARLSGNCPFLPGEAHQVSERWALLPHTSLARIEMQMRFSGIEEQVNAGNGSQR